MKRYSLFRISPLAAGVLMALTGSAHSFGLNNIYGSQAIGKPFYAEIPMQAAPGVSESCISVRVADGAAEFFMPDLKAAVTGPGNARRIVITSQSAVRSPMIQFLVDVRCGESTMAREYVLLADNAPFEPTPRRTDNSGAVNTVAALPTAGTATDAATNDAGEVVLLSAATTLNAMARAIYPEDRAARDAYRAAFTRANPDRFAGKDNIGSIPLAAGTRLNAPVGTPLSGSGVTRSEKPAGKTATAKRTEGSRSVERAKSDGSKTDRLSIGTANPQLQMLADAMLRLEASTAERDKINAELVGGVSGALNSIIELRDRLSAQDEQVKQLITLQIESERRRALEKEEALGPLGLLALLLAAMAAGGGLIALHHTLAGRRQATTAELAGETLDWDELDEQPAVAASAPRDVRAQATADAVDERSSEFVPVPALAQPVIPSPPPTPVTPAVAPRASTMTPAQQEEMKLHEESKQDMELDDLLDLFGEQRTAVMAMTRRLRATGSRDPDEWLGLVRQARAAGLMNSDEMQLMSTELKRLFNVNLNAEPADMGLESFPRVLSQLTVVWGRNDGLTFLNSLLFDDREGGRAGFPELCFEELVTLREVLAARLAMFGEDSSATTPPAAAPSPQLTRAELRDTDASMIEFELSLPPADKV